MKLTGFLDINPLGSSTPTWASLVAGVFVLISLSLSMYLLFEHLSSYKNPEVLLHHNYNFIVLSLDICSVWCIYLVNLCFFFCFFCSHLTGAKVFDRSHLNGSLLCNWIGKPVGSHFLYKSQRWVESSFHSELVNRTCGWMCVSGFFLKIS